MDYKIKGETLTEIADAIRDKTGSTEAIKPEDMANGVEEVAAAISQAEYDKFWDEYQSNGTRTNCRFMFSGPYWTEERIKKYKYPLCPNDRFINGYMIFAHNSNIVDTTTFLKEEDQKLYLSNSEYSFSTCSKLEHVGKINLENYISSTFTECSKLKVIDELQINSSNGISPFYNNSNLTYIKWTGENCTGIPINLSSAKKETTIIIPEDVYDNEGNLVYAAGEEITETGVLYYPTISTLIPALKTGANKTLTLGENINKLIQNDTQNDIATITGKGWTVV